MLLPLLLIASLNAAAAPVDLAPYNGTFVLQKASSSDDISSVIDEICPPKIRITVADNDHVWLFNAASEQQLISFIRRPREKTSGGDTICTSNIYETRFESDGLYDFNRCSLILLETHILTRPTASGAMRNIKKSSLFGVTTTKWDCRYQRLPEIAVSAPLF